MEEVALTPLSGYDPDWDKEIKINTGLMTSSSVNIPVDFLGWIILKGTFIIKFASFVATTATLYTIPAGSVFFLTGAFLSRGGGAAALLYDGVHLFIMQNDGDKSINFNTPLKIDAGGVITAEISGVGSQGRAGITGYLVDRVVIEDLKKKFF